MKPQITIFLTALVTAFSLTGAVAQETDFNPLGRDVPSERMEKQLRIQVEWIELSHTDFTALMEEHHPGEPDTRQSSDDGLLRAKLKKMIEEDKAEIIDTAMVLARSGQRAKVEAVREVIYATEYGPPKVGGTEKRGGESKAQDNAGDKSKGLPIAAAFETRNVGTTLEVDPVLGADERTIDLSLSPEIVYHVGQEEYGVYREGESEVVAKMPLFYTMKLTTQVAMIAGEYLFAGVQSPFDMEAMEADRGRKVMVFLKADVLYVGLPLKEEKKTGKEDKKK
jgi:hypothetical protein